MKRLILLVFACMALQVFSQVKKPTTPPSTNADSVLMSKLKYRLVGPWRGGRSGAVTGSYKNRNTFYFGSTGGGVWKTADGGSNWKNISDKFFGGSIGAVSVAPSDENVIYAGEGENTMRGNVSEGLGGFWRSDDGGRTWKNAGLKDGRHIIRIVIHPRDPNTVWVAVMGHLFGPNEERGVFKTTDGGKTWKKTLYINNQTGCSELVMEPGNPAVLYAGTWRLIRTPYSLESGGDGSGLWKSTDGGDTWTSLKTKKGLPAGVWGIVGVAVAPSNPDKIYALVENEKGGLFISNDGGDTWTLGSNDNNIRQRAWYYSRVYVDPKNENTVYCPNVNFMRSRDGGKTFQAVNTTPHGDHHDLWLDPEDGNRMIVADDGGAQVSFDGASNWSSYMNQPTAQFYRVTTDNSFPYRILGAQQDNSTVRIKSRTYGAAITEQDWEPTAGAESGYVVADPLNPDIVYGGNYGGYLSRLDHKTGENRAISVWPDNPMGAGADVQRFRFQWNFPIFFSPHNPKKLYCAGNALFATENEGANWQQISPDLTTNDKSKQKSSGGPITQDNTSVEYYCTIFTACESVTEESVLWTGSDDGVISVSKDSGKNWENVTPKDCPKWIMWNCVETDPFRKGVAYFAGTRYKSDDYAPYLYMTEDYGKTWKLIVSGIDKMHFTRAIRADHKKPGLLYAGTEFGMYISYDYGTNWKKFQLNLPVVPITDLTIKENDLIVATQGRAFWILDDLTQVQELNPDIANRNLHVYPVNTTYRMSSGGFRNFGAPRNAGMNPPAGLVLNYYAKNVTDSTKASVTIMDKDKKLIRTFSTDAKEAKDKFEITPGTNKFNWNLVYPESERMEGMVLWNGVPGGILAAPGRYYYKMKVGADTAEGTFTVLPDPNYKISQADYDAQFEFLTKVQGRFNDVQQAIKDIRTLRSQINEFTGRQEKDSIKEIKTLADSINKKLTGIEEALYQTKAKSSQDVLNYPIRLNDKLSGLFDAANSGNMAPSKQCIEVYADLSVKCDEQLQKLNDIRNKDIPALNELIRAKAVPVIGLKKEKEKM